MSTPRNKSSNRSIWKWLGLSSYLFFVRRTLLFKTFIYIGFVNAIRVIIYYAANF